MITVVIPTLNAAPALGRTLAALVPAAVEGLVKEVVIADGGSTDGTASIADAAGARLVATAPGRGGQLAAGADEARGRWLLFLHADTVLEPGYIAEVAAFCRRTAPSEPKAAVFRFALDDDRFAARLLEFGVRFRTGVIGLPYGDQGLLIGADAYRRLGGYKPLPLMEDVELVRRLGRGAITRFATRAVTSAERYRREGYGRRVARNITCLALYFLGVAPRRIAEFYR
ncbi:Glycosyl transferase, group 2 family [hydrothermal vent metagenome]|uniref:Glycosyl transferase, group 2 family n=1 Tax=hydrothermal vent metagenome TaxID=652676 RepID=A0A3B0SWS6_9ZZZZ